MGGGEFLEHLNVIFNFKRTTLLQGVSLFVSLLVRGGTVVKVLCYKSEGRWFDSSWCQWIFH